MPWIVCLLHLYGGAYPAYGVIQTSFESAVSIVPLVFKCMRAVVPLWMASPINGKFQLIIKYL
jgi:hypothetical protein